MSGRKILFDILIGKHSLALRMDLNLAINTQSSLFKVPKFYQPALQQYFDPFYVVDNSDFMYIPLSISCNVVVH